MDVYNNKKNFQLFVAQTGQFIDSLDSVRRITTNVIRKSYRLTYLDMIWSALSEEDAGTLLSLCWTDSENANLDANVSLDTIIGYFNEIPKKYLMTTEEIREYEALEDKITVYRGIGSKSNKEGLSWTINKDVALWFSRRFSDSGGCVIRGLADKSSVLAYYKRRNEYEVVINPDDVLNKKILDE